MKNPKLKIHEWIQDDINWIKLTRISTADLTPYKRVRNNNAILGRKTLSRFVEEYSIITNDKRDPIQITLDLLSPVEESFISG